MLDDSPRLDIDELDLPKQWRRWHATAVDMLRGADAEPVPDGGVVHLAGPDGTSTESRRVGPIRKRGCFQRKDLIAAFHRTAMV
jgi:hypothetical protein